MWWKAIVGDTWHWHWPLTSSLSFCFLSPLLFLLHPPSAPHLWCYWTLCLWEPLLVCHLPCCYERPFLGWNTNLTSPLHRLRGSSLCQEGFCFHGDWRVSLDGSLQVTLQIYFLREQEFPFLVHRLLGLLWFPSCGSYSSHCCDKVSNTENIRYGRLI